MKNIDVFNKEFNKFSFITVDDYYDVNMYNEIMSAAKNNGIPYMQFIRIKPPYTRYLMIEKDNIPKFINYDEATDPDKVWLVSTVRPVETREAFLLKRREGQDISYWNYILPEPLIDMNKQDYVMVFKAYDMSVMKEISKKLGKDKIYQWGRSYLKGYKIFVCFNPYIKALLMSKDILLEYSNKDKKIPKVPKEQGRIEYELNHFILIREKLINKTYLLPYYSSGKYFPINKKTFID